MKQQGKFLSLLVIYSYTVVCLPVRGDNPRALASGLSHVQMDNHIITILYQLHQCCYSHFKLLGWYNIVSLHFWFKNTKHHFYETAGEFSLTAVLVCSSTAQLFVTPNKTNNDACVPA